MSLSHFIISWILFPEVIQVHPQYFEGMRARGNRGVRQKSRRACGQRKLPRRGVRQEPEINQSLSLRHPTFFELRAVRQK